MIIVVHARGNPRLLRGKSAKAFLSLRRNDTAKFPSEEPASSQSCLSPA